MKSIRSVIQELSGMGITVRYLDMGGGLGITYDSEAPPQPADYARAIVDSLKGAPIRLILEPGRVLVGNAGILVTQVLYRKTAGEKSFIVVDAGMNDLLRPSIYKAFHGITPVEKNTAEPLVADVVGPICESGDFLAQDRKIFSTGRGDLLAVMSAGAYGFAMSSNYCSRLKVAEVMVQGDRFEVVRRRQTYADLVAGESVPSFLD
jgi:diaminopimelate decarboxylase